MPLGISLAELIVVAAVGAVVSTVTIGFILSLFRGAARVTVRDGLKSRAIVVVDRILNEMREATVVSIQLQPTADASAGSPGVGFTRLLTVTGTGQRVWEEKSLFYFWTEDSKTLWHTTCPPLPAGINHSYVPGRPPVFADEELPTLFTTGDNAGPLIRGVTNFAVQENGSLLRLTLSLQEQSHANRKESFRVVRSLKLRNP
jgi:hypothetical protein